MCKIENITGKSIIELCAHINLYTNYKVTRDENDKLSIDVKQMNQDKKIVQYNVYITDNEKDYLLVVDYNFSRNHYTTSTLYFVAHVVNE